MAKNKAKLNKFLTGAVTATMVAAAVVPVAAASTNVAATEFSDVPATDTHYQNIMQAVERGLFNGYADGTFKPYQDLKRSHVAKVLANYVVNQDGAVDYAAYIEKHELATNVTAFADVSSTHSDKELFNASLIVKNAKIFEGSNNNLMPTKTINRQQMAKVLVNAFGLKDLPGDLSKVTDNDKAFAEFRTYIDILSENGVTTESKFKPGSAVKRGQMASFLNRAYDVADKAVAVGVESVKAVNATTVEVTFKNKVENVGTFTIEGLAVSNAAVKQTNDKVVVITTAVQTGGTKYAVKLDGNAVGSFGGISAVIPTKIDITTQSVQGKVGAQAILSADVGVKQAGIPVTFNVKAETTRTLNQDQVFESVTNADGIATFSYTQYAAGTDSVVAYPTGAPTVRSLGYVFWGVDTILAIEANDKKTDSVNNGEDKTYKLTYLNPETGKPVANERFFITFAENVNVNVDKTSKATVNGDNPRQLLNNEDPKVAEVTTDSKGQAVFTVSGSNTAVTPVVFLDNGNRDLKVSKTYEASKLQASAAKVTFGALQAEYDIAVTREGGEEAAIGIKNGREYKVIVKTKDGKVAANELVNVAFNEDLDRVINTDTEAYFVDGDGNYVPNPRTESHTVKTDSKGEATFTIANDDPKGYATPIVWIDINSSNAKEGRLDESEPSKIAAISYFDYAKLTDGAVNAYDAIDEVPRANKKEFDGNEDATFKFSAANQSGKTMDLDSNYNHVSATFTVFNTGANDITIIEPNGQEQIVSPQRSYTTKTITNLTVPYITVKSGNKTTTDVSTSVRVVANGTAVPKAGSNERPVNLGSHEVKAEFVSTSSVGSLYTGIVEQLDTNKKQIKFFTKNKISYANATYKNSSSVTLTQSEFERIIGSNVGTAKVTYKKSGDDVTFEIVSAAEDTATNIVVLQKAVQDANTLVTAAKAGEEVGEYPQSAIDTYKTAIETARKVLINNASTQAEVDAAITALATATTAFSEAKVKEEVVAEFEFTASKKFDSVLLELLESYSYTVEGTVADAAADTEVTITFSNATQTKVAKTTVNADGAFVFVKAAKAADSGEDVYYDYTDVKVSYTNKDGIAQTKDKTVTVK